MNGSNSNQSSRLLPTPHGFGDDARSWVLRGRPPDAALRWVEVVTGGRVRAVRAYRGGSSSSIHGVRLDLGSATQTVVLRRYVIDSLNDEEPDIAEREARVLGLLEQCNVPTPGLLAVDVNGDDAGHPAVLMTRVPGRLEWSPTDLEPWLHRLAAVLPTIHEAPITAGVQEFVPYEPPSWDPPAWLQDPRLWERALGVFHGPRLDPDRVFIHRDYHPGNVLWRRGRVSGVVDWQAASLGPRTADVWHCRGNLLGRFGLDIADRFVEVWESVSGSTYHPWTEAVMLVDAIGWMHPRSAVDRVALESLLARRLTDVGA